MEDQNPNDLDERLRVLEIKFRSLEATMGQVVEVLDTLVKSATSASSSPQPSGPPMLELVSVNTKPTESNSTWTKWAWRIVVKNNSSKAVLFLAHLQFRDADSFALDEQTSDTFRIAPLTENVFTGYRMVDASIANLVDSIYANLTVVG
jgi:hypothetical protein